MSHGVNEPSQPEKFFLKQRFFVIDNFSCDSLVCDQGSLQVKFGSQIKIYLCMLQKKLHVTISLFERGLLNKKNLLIMSKHQNDFPKIEDNNNMKISSLMSMVRISNLIHITNTLLILPILHYMIICLYYFYKQHAEFFWSCFY